MRTALSTFLFILFFALPAGAQANPIKEVEEYLAANSEKYSPDAKELIQGILEVAKEDKNVKDVSLLYFLRGISVGSNEKLRNTNLFFHILNGNEVETLRTSIQTNLKKTEERSYPSLIAFLKSIKPQNEKVSAQDIFISLLETKNPAMREIFEKVNNGQATPPLTVERIRSNSKPIEVLTPGEPKTSTSYGSAKLKDIIYPSSQEGADFIKSVVKDLSAEAMDRLSSNNRPKFTERPGQMESLKQSLFRDDKNGTFIVAKRGAGKTATVRDGLTYELLDSERTNPKSVLFGMRIIQLDNHAFMGNKLSESEKIKYLIEFIKLNSKKTEKPRSVGNMLLFIDEVHELKKEKDGIPQFFDALKIPLASGEANLIVATTDEEFLKNFTEAGDDAILRRLVISNIDMFNEAEVFTILRAFTKDPKRTLSESQLQKIIEMAKAYFPSDSLIDKVLDIIHEVEGIQRFEADKLGTAVSHYDFNDKVVFQSLSRLTGISYKFLSRTPKEITDELRSRLGSHISDKEQLEHLVQTIRASIFSKTKPYKNKLNLLLLIDDPVKAKKITETILSCIYGLSEERVTTITARELGEGERLLQKLMGYEGLYQGAKTATDVLSKMKENQRGALLVHGIDKTTDPGNLFSVFNRWITVGLDYSPNKPGAIDTSGTIMIFTVSRNDVAVQLAKAATEILRDARGPETPEVQPEQIPERDILRALEHMLPGNFLTLVSSGKVVVKNEEKKEAQVGEFETIILDKITDIIRNAEKDHDLTIHFSEAEKMILKDHYLNEIGIYGTTKDNLNFFLDVEMEGKLKDLIESYVITEKAKDGFAGQVTLTNSAMKFKLCEKVLSKVADSEKKATESGN